MFVDREDAARRLASVLGSQVLVDPLVLGIPRGGVVLAAIIAHQLGAEMDVVLARKLRAPLQRELAIGAIDEDGQVILDSDVASAVGADRQYLDEERRVQHAALLERRKRLRSIHPPATVAGRSVVVTDDGVATGATMLAAIRSVRARSPRELIAAVPVAAADRLEDVARQCDRTVCLETPARFGAVGEFYRDFDPVSDGTVRRLLELEHERTEEERRRVDD